MPSDLAGVAFLLLRHLACPPALLQDQYTRNHSCDEQKDIDSGALTTGLAHKDCDIAILEVGKHLYAEKPLALTAA